MQAILCGWYGYTAVIAGLVGMSAGRATLMGRMALVAAIVSLGLMVTLYVPLPEAETLLLAGKVYIGVVGLLALIRGPSTDTRTIALFLLAGAGLPLFLHFYQPAG